jgi:hypothetical protein
MAQVHYAPFSFEPPEGWQDRTIVAFVAPSQPGDSTVPNVVVAREPRRDGDTLQTHVQRQLLALSNELDEFDMLESEELVVGGRRAMRTRCVWSGNGGVIDQTVVHIDPEEGEKTVMSLTCTSSVASSSLVWPVFDRLLASLQPMTRPAATFATPVPPSAPREVRAEPGAPLFSMPGVRAKR